MLNRAQLNTTEQTRIQQSLILLKDSTRCESVQFKYKQIMVFTFSTSVYSKFELNQLAQTHLKYFAT